MLLHAEVKCGPVDFQSRSGPVGTGDNPAGVCKSLAYVVPLRFFQRNCLLGLALDRGRGRDLQARGAQDILRAKNYTPLDKVLELANVSGPRVRDKLRHRF